MIWLRTHVHVQPMPLLSQDQENEFGGKDIAWRTTSTSLETRVLTGHRPANLLARAASQRVHLGL